MIEIETGSGTLHETMHTAIMPRNTLFLSLMTAAALSIVVYSAKSEAGSARHEVDSSITTPAPNIQPLLGINLPTNISSIVAAFGKPIAMELPDEEDPSPWGQWFRWHPKNSAEVFTALGDDYDSKKPNLKAGVRVIELRANKLGRATKTILGFRFHSTTRKDVTERLAGWAQPSNLFQRGELGANNFYRSTLKYSSGNLWTYFFFGTEDRLVGIIQATFDMDEAD
jgi:hypothetical protein